MNFNYLTTDDGLSQNRVSCIFRDSRDYVWFGTADGLNKYNGAQIEVYRNNPEDPKSLCGNRVLCIAEDAENNIWVGTMSGLSMYNAEDNSFTSYFNTKSNGISISSNSIPCLFLDKQQNFWVGSRKEKCLNKWNPDSKTFTSYQIPHKKNKMHGHAVTSITQDKNGNLWLASHLHEGIDMFNPENEKFIAHESPITIPEEITFLFTDNDGIIWISTYGSGLYSYNPETQKYTAYNTIGNGQGTNASVIFNIIQEDNNNLLIAVDQGGINRYNKQTNSFEYIKRNPNTPNTLNNNGVWCLHKDKEDILWVGTSAKGVNIYNPKSEKFNLIRTIPNYANSLCYDVVNNIYEDSKGLIWFSTDGGGVSAFNPQTGNFKNYKTNPNTPYSIQCDVIRHTIEDKNHNYWFATWDGGLIKLDHKTDRFIQYLPKSIPPYNISGPSIWHQMVDHNGLIWLSIYNIGIDLLDPDKGIVRKIRLNPNTKTYYEHAVVTYMYEDSHNNIWLCTEAGLELFDTLTSTTKTIPVFPEGEDLNFILEDKEGYYWAGSTTMGLVRFTLDGTILKKYTKTEGLPSNKISALIEDDSQNIWVSTNNGICRINYQTEKIRNYSISDGLQGNQFISPSYLKTKSGEIYFGGSNGVNSFIPDSVKDNNYPPKVYINEFLIFNKPVPVGTPDSPLQKVIEQTKKIELNWEQTVFSFGFLAINYTHPEKNLYAYKMDGFDKEWNYTDASRRMATYTNLNPGTYTFLVKASNNDGVWNEQMSSIKITITPPFWLTLWFKTATILLITILIYSWVRYRLSRAKNESLKLEGLVAKRTSQLEYANKELEAFSYSVSHDLRAPLNSIDGFSYLLQKKYKDNLDDKGQSYLKHVRIASQRMAQLIDDMLNLSKVSHGELNIRQVNLSHIVNKITNELRETDLNRKVKFIIQDEVIVNADGRLLRIVLENLIGNAWKYSSKHSTTCIEFGMSQKEGKVTYFVRDDGAGFDMKYAQKLFGAFQRMHDNKEFEGTGIGLATVQRIIHRHGGKVWAESEVEKGATFYFTI